MKCQGFVAAAQLILHVYPEAFSYDPNPWAFLGGKDQSCIFMVEMITPLHIDPGLEGCKKHVISYQTLYRKWLSNPGQTCRHVQLRKYICQTFSSTATS